MIRLNIRERRVLKKFTEQRNWRIRNNQEVQEVYEDLDSVVDIKRKMLGHLKRMNTNRKLRKIADGKPEG